MTTHAFAITVADGDDFTRTFTSRVVVAAATPLEARLVAEQLAHTPHPGKPDHLQIVHTEEIT